MLVRQPREGVSAAGAGRPSADRDQASCRGWWPLGTSQHDHPVLWHPRRWPHRRLLGIPAADVTVSVGTGAQSPREPPVRPERRGRCQVVRVSHLLDQPARSPSRGADGSPRRDARESDRVRQHHAPAVSAVYSSAGPVCIPSISGRGWTGSFWMRTRRTSSSAGATTSAAARHVTSPSMAESPNVWIP
jgi:hypothetical protein